MRRRRWVSSLGLSRTADPPAEPPDIWERHVATLKAQGIDAPGTSRDASRRPATVADEEALYEASPSFVDLLPWVEYLPESQCMLLEDGESVAAFFELVPVGTEGRDARWLTQVRDALENALQDSLDELESSPWVVQLYAQDETEWDTFLRTLHAYVHPRACESEFSRFYLRLFQHHLQATSRPEGLFKDTTVTHLPWRGQTRRVRLVVYRRIESTRSTAGRALRSSPSAEQALNRVCDRLTGGLAHAGIKAKRLDAADIHAWLLRWFNPHPTMLGDAAEDRERFYQLTRYPLGHESPDLELASGTDFAQRLFFREPRSDAMQGLWYFDDVPHRVVVLDRLRTPPSIGHVTGETRNGAEAVNALFDQMPEGTVMCLTMVVVPQDSLEAHLNFLGRKSVGETLASEQTRQDIQQARTLIGRAHKLYRGSVAFYLRGHNSTRAACSSRT